MISSDTNPVLKRAVMWVIVLSIPLLFLLLCVEGYYAYHKLSDRTIFCSPFSQVDDEAGWVLRRNVQSCYGVWDVNDRSQPAFYSKIYTDKNGFRSASQGETTPVAGIMLVGDSWTFGYGVDYEQGFPGQLADKLKTDVVTAASPGYGAAQALVLAERWIERLSPRALVYLDLGHWARSACTGDSRPRVILKPCYWENPTTGNAELVLPPPGFVQTAARWGLKPGGMLGAGEDGWDYFLISRPVSKVLGFLARAGVMSGMAHDFRAVAVNDASIKRGVVDHLVRLARTADVPLLVLDPQEIYAEFHSTLATNQTVVIGSREWRESVTIPADSLPPGQREVPQDGHFGPGTNALVAALIAKWLGTLLVAGST